LEQEVVPCFYRQRDRFIEVMRHAIALNGAFFNTHRMVRQYVDEAYRLTTVADGSRLDGMSNTEPLPGGAGAKG
jgi:glucan phosphorylase